MQVALLCCLAFAMVAGERHVLGERTTTNFPKKWSLLGEAHKSTPLNFIVALKQNNLAQLEQTFWEVADPDHANYRNFMTIEEITRVVAPSKADQKRVITWLKEHGVSTIINRGDALDVMTTVEVASKLFHTKFHVFQRTCGKTMVRQVGKYSVPTKLADIIDMVAGLSEFPNPKTVQRVNSGMSPNTPVTISPQSLQLIYGTTTAYVTGNSSAGVIEFEAQNYAPSDLAQFASQFGVNIPPLTANHIVGQNDPTNPQIEATLDIQYILAVAQKATGWFWLEGDNVWLYGFATHMFSTNNVPLVNSISYGWNEEDQCEDGIGAQECNALGVDSKGYVRRVNVEFQKIGLRGITLFSASGDSGANGRTDPDCSESNLNPPFPAASPFITSVGATQITDASGKANLPGGGPPGCQGQSCASGGTEVAVSFDQAHFASGGGFSWVASMPAYQSAAVNAYLTSGVKLPPSGYFNPTGHAFPHVAALGSQVLILSQGSIEPVGGTSASSPIFAGVVTLLNDYVNAKTGKPLGFVSPLLFKMAAAHPMAFTDITVGDNICTENGCSSSCTGFLCAKGWDPVTGLGTPVYPEMLKYIKSQFNI